MTQGIPTLTVLQQPHYRNVCCGEMSREYRGLVNGENDGRFQEGDSLCSALGLACACGTTTTSWYR